MNNQNPQAPQPPVKLPFQDYGGTHVGKQRQANEDSYLDWHKWQQPGQPMPPQVQQKGFLWVVADGMGGHVGGQRASSTVVEQMVLQYYQAQTADPQQSLRHAVEMANRAVQEAARKEPKLEGMGSTMVAAALVGNTMHIAWVGDSRAYLLRGNRFEALTSDHSWIEQAVKQGTVTRSDSINHPNRNIILRSVGTSPEVQPDFTHSTVQPGDVYLLCSDGLCGVASDGEMERVLNSSRNEQEAINQLIALANGHGGPDNITAAVISFGRFAGGAVAGAPMKKPNTMPLYIGGLVLLGIIIFLFFNQGKDNSASVTPSPEIAVGVETSVVVTPTLTISQPTTQIITPTYTPVVTFTPLPPPTPAPVATVNPIQPKSPTATVPSEPTATPTTQIIGTITLSEPVEGTTLVTGRPIEFKWQWSGGELPPNHDFHVLIYPATSPDHFGAYDVKEKLTKPNGNQQYTVSFDPASAQCKAECLLSVAVVKIEPYQIIMESTTRKVVVSVPGGGGGSGGSSGGGSGGGTPKPTEPTR